MKGPPLHEAEIEPELVTKQDVKELRMEMAQMKADLIRWTISCNLALGAILVAVMAWLK